VVAVVGAVVPSPSRRTTREVPFFKNGATNGKKQRKIKYRRVNIQGA
jgi:hypothetical protein